MHQSSQNLRTTKPKQLQMPHQEQHEQEQHQRILKHTIEVEKSHRQKRLDNSISPDTTTLHESALFDRSDLKNRTTMIRMTPNENTTRATTCNCASNSSTTTTQQKNCHFSHPWKTRGDVLGYLMSLFLSRM